MVGRSRESERLNEALATLHERVRPAGRSVPVPRRRGSGDRQKAASRRVPPRRGRARARDPCRRLPRGRRGAAAALRPDRARAGSSCLRRGERERDRARAAERAALGSRRPHPRTRSARAPHRPGEVARLRSCHRLAPRARPPRRRSFSCWRPSLGRRSDARASRLSRTQRAGDPPHDRRQPPRRERGDELVPVLAAGLGTARVVRAPPPRAAGREEVRLLLGAMFEGTDIDPGLARTPGARVRSNPLFLLEILRSLQSENALARTASGWRLPEIEGRARRDPRGSRPARWRGASARSRATRRVCWGALAVLARPVGPELAAEVADVPADRAAAGLEALAARGLLARRRAPVAGYVFEHALVRRAAEDRLDAQERRGLHPPRRRDPGARGTRRARRRRGDRETTTPLAVSPSARCCSRRRPADLSLSRHAGRRRRPLATRARSRSPPAATAAARPSRGCGSRPATAASPRAITPPRARTSSAASRSPADPGTARGARPALERLGTVLGFQRTAEEGTDFVGEALALFRELGDLLGERARSTISEPAMRAEPLRRGAPLLPRRARDSTSVAATSRRWPTSATAWASSNASSGAMTSPPTISSAGSSWARSVDYRYLMAATRHNLGIVRRSQGRYEEALASVREALALFDEIGHRNAYGFSMLNLGIYGRRRGTLRGGARHLPPARAPRSRAPATRAARSYALECEADLLRFLGPAADGDRPARRGDPRRRARLRTSASAATRRRPCRGRCSMRDAARRPSSARARRWRSARRPSARASSRGALVALAAALLATGHPAEAAARARELLARSASEALLEEMAAEGNLILGSAMVEPAGPGRGRPRRRRRRRRHPRARARAPRASRAAHQGRASRARWGTLRRALARAPRRDERRAMAGNDLRRDAAPLVLSPR
jgi:hypothetical protein